MSLLINTYRFAAAGGGGEGGGFAPGDLPNLQAWYAADEITGLSDTDPVSQWDDLSGNGRHLVQATGAKQPQFRTGVLNGLPAVRFSNDFLRRAVWPSTSAASIVVVAQATSAISSTATVFGGENSSGQGSFQLLGFDSSGYKWTMFNGNIRADGPVDTNPHLFVADVTNSTSDRLRIDGVDTGIPTGFGSRSLDQDVTVGSNGSDSQPWPGDVFDVLVVSPVLTASELADVETYYLNRYAL